jgi:predicted RNA-binding Zn ribbon-like protein
VTFVFVSGDLALDFLGTRKWRRDDWPEEMLATPDDLARWAVEAAVLTERPVIDEAELAGLRDLREAIYRLVTASLHGGPWPAADRTLLNSHAQGRPPELLLTADHLVRKGNAESIGWAAARAAADLLSQSSELNLRECDRTDCTRIFIDRSRSGNRRWCGMQECGNRIKAASYRARKAAH